MPGLWRRTDFRLLWAGQTVSQLGEHTALTILPLLAVLTLDAGADQLGLLRAAGQAPQLLLALFAGVWVDRWRTRTVMVCSDLGRAVALAVTGAAAVSGTLGLPALLAVTVVVGALSVFFDIAYQASLTRLVERDLLLPAGSAIEASRSAAQIAGPAVGGAVASLPFAPAAVAVAFLASLAAIAPIREAAPPAPAVRPHIRAGLRFVAGDGALRAICAASGAFQFFLAATMTGYLLFLPRELGLSATAIGLTLAAVGPGALAGSLLAARLPRRLGHGPVLVGAAVIGNGAMLAVPALHGSSAGTLAALVAVNLVSGTFGQLVNVTVIAVRQALTPDALQGRVAATIMFAGMGLTPFGSLFGGLLADRWTLRAALLICTAGMMLSPAIMLVSPLARLGRTVPARAARPAGSRP
ncbi:MFS transporter [Actinoplanes italicus]|uniref:Putative MFS family arabinose efflux permease n=1 Tax=Actinoplanes italicus TaxID=113567 RepID=A0A2T0KGW3_9ACTN|nr:MFS transporter [Actinoplanes italicus]PRX22676.1 putative MFS family arabinose efflux permease [Actinoplanes italicus]GIE28196.1 MFS transporter [Actinoplanes italicus]